MNFSKKNRRHNRNNSYLVNKIVVLTLVVSIFTSVGIAQNTSIPMKVFNVENSVDILKITDDISRDELELELINNFFKIELADIRLDEGRVESKDSNILKIDLPIQNNFIDSHYKVISDITVRTTKEMRPTLFEYESRNA